MKHVDSSSSPFDELIGTKWGSVEADHAMATLAVEDRHMQPFGSVHGGVLCALAEAVTSRATAEAVLGDGKAAFGQAIQVSYLRTINGGTVRVDARRRHEGRTSWVWDVEISDDEGRLCALARMTVAIRPIRT